GGVPGARGAADHARRRHLDRRQCRRPRSGRRHEPAPVAGADRGRRRADRRGRPRRRAGRAAGRGPAGRAALRAGPEHAPPLPERGFDVARALVGSEGSLAVVLGATVRLVPEPAHRGLVVLGYPSMAEAADATPALLPHRPTAVEGLDARIVQRLRDVPAAVVPAVPPEQLGAYLRGFDELLASHGLTGVPYGHFGDGCVHVRIDFPFRAGQDGADRGRSRYRAFVTDAAALVIRYGGSLSGEHGDGRARSELLATMYSGRA